jgi:hypothetical protein
LSGCANPILPRSVSSRPSSNSEVAALPIETSWPTRRVSFTPPPVPGNAATASAASAGLGGLPLGDLNSLDSGCS